MKLLEMNNVRKGFGKTEVLKNISLSVEQGEVVSIIGPSGSGKSTLLRCATMLEKMDSGELIYFDKKRHGMIKTAIVYMPRKTSLRKFRAIIVLFFKTLIFFHISQC